MDMDILSEITEFINFGIISFKIKTLIHTHKHISTNKQPPIKIHPTKPPPPPIPTQNTQ